ncbi:hypothetical protein ETAA8_00430 [Anatilimnocola aggregata]|uniref:3-keto-alpha-glucoside-1,2-lyase/3-keto-2-hydroxy-glucal hydratase domain-containing protein n=1 Tax=Anatilimnocola aggregata TaxID=2528021 RepID=A0A517Y4C7_9BACT|nr:DUF1080 domain-containing protein [Anatilimnocola aggregata]QDU24982.1 hypothetical protein ETAA8_00430 [Anatilimnocola aggregata]
MIRDAELSYEATRSRIHKQKRFSKTNCTLHVARKKMRSLFTGLMLCLLVVMPGESLAQTLDKAAEAAAKKLFDRQSIGIELKMQGEYVGQDGDKPVGVQVVARGDKAFHALVLEGGLPGDGWDGGRYGLLESGPISEGRAEFRSPNDEGWGAVLDENGLTLKRGDRKALLKRVDRKSETLGLQPPAGAIVLFGGMKPNVDAFEERKDIEGQTSPLMFEGNMMAGAVTKRRFRDYMLHVEFMTGWEPQNIPWRRADAGIYMLARYEVAIGDSFGFDFDLSGATSPNRPQLVSDKKTSSKFPEAKQSSAPRVCGSVFTYQSKVPNSCLPPLVWQTLDIEFTAPRFDDNGKKTSKAVISVKLNGHQTVDKLEVNGPTPHGFKGPETPDGPIWFEAFGRRVLYRNIWVVERR